MSIWASGLEKQHCHTTTWPAAHRHAHGGCKPVPQNCDGRANPAPASAARQLQGCTCRGEQTSNPGLTNHTTAWSHVANPNRFVFWFLFFVFFPAIAQKRALLIPPSEGAAAAYPLLTYSRSQTFH